jgi:hypothetical protein
MLDDGPNPYEGLHPYYASKLSFVAERLCDISAGRLMTRAGLERVIGEVMYGRRLSAFDECSHAIAKGVLSRSLARADHRLGSAGMAEIVRDEIAQVLQ